MLEPFFIYIDGLQKDHPQKIDVVLPPDFFEIRESDLSFTDPVKISGEAYVVDDELVFRFHAATIAKMACSICNGSVSLPLAVKDFYHTEPLASIAKAKFDFRPAIRNALLVELPKTAECGGNCPQRDALSPYLKKTAASCESPHYFPFNDLKLP